MAPVRADGTLLRQAPEEGSSIGLRRSLWRRTLFVAALDGANQRAWSREGGLPVGEPGRLPTQRRWLEQGGRLLGLDPQVPETTRERVADRLLVPSLTLWVAGRAYASARRSRARGAAIVRVLDQISVRQGLADDLLVCGALTGLWGRPSRWDPGGGSGVLLPLF